MSMCPRRFDARFVVMNESAYPGSRVRARLRQSVAIARHTDLVFVAGAAAPCVKIDKLRPNCASPCVVTRACLRGQCPTPKNFSNNWEAGRSRGKVEKMCILFMFNGTHDAKSDYSLVLISNRDQYYTRKTQNMGPWKEDPNVYGGRDLEDDERGTWLAVAPTRKKLGVLLTLPGSNNPAAKGRGSIVADYVKSEKPVKTYIEQKRNYAMNCNDFIFVSVEFRSGGPTVSSYSTANDELTTNKEAYVGFGNCLPKKPLKKVDAGKNKLMQILSTFNKVCMQEELLDKLIELLKSDEKHLPDHQLETMHPNLYKELSSIFMCIPEENYGTRTHTIVLVTKTGHMKIIEITQEAPIDPLMPKWTRTELEFDMELK